MSEYSYYEFQAIDRPLTEAERRELRSCSSRATITSTRFTNHYEWGNFRGNPAEWMERYFDASFCMANWNTRELSFRLPKRLLDPRLARQYCCGEVASVRAKGDFVILDFLCEDGEWDDYGDDGSGWLSSLIPLRADLRLGTTEPCTWLGCSACRLEAWRSMPRSRVPSLPGSLSSPRRLRPSWSSSRSMGT